MFYVGLDIHTKHITICILDNHGQVHDRCQVRQVDQLIDRLKRIEDPFEVCFEASTGYGDFFELLSKLAARVVVAHPKLLKLIYGSKKKNDRNDAQKLAKLLYVGEVPAVHVPSAEVRAWREMILYRHQLIGERTRTKNRIRALLRTVGLRPARRPGLWGRAGMAWLRSLEFSQPMHKVKLGSLLNQIETVNRDISLVERELERWARNSVAVRQLRSIPGVGIRTAEAVAAFLDDPHRFANAKRVGSYFGLVPCQDQSGNVNRLGHITREGCATVRQLLTEAAWQSLRRSPTVRDYFERIRRGDKDRRKIALTATAHYLVRVMWAMLRDGSLWQERVQAV
jgi:transposase